MSKNTSENISNFSSDQYGEKYRDHVLEEYKLYVEMADKISQRRMDTNNFFVSANTLLIAVITFLNSWGKETSIITSIVGIVLSISWYFLLQSYRKLNSGKFLVIHKIEQLLPISMYDIEWNTLGRGKDHKKYWSISHLEKVLPIVFLIIYVLILIWCLMMGFNYPTDTPN